MSKYFSVFLVSSQISLIILLAVTGDIFPDKPILFILEIIFAILGIWAMAEVKFRFNVFPQLLKNSPYITSGPYKIVRHPMYTSIIFITLIWIINDFIFMRLIAWLLLILVLNKKTLYEEKILDKEFPEYESYKSKSKKLIPFIY